MQFKVSSTWHKGVQDETEVKEIKETVLRAAPALERLQKILNQKLEGRKPTKRADYDNPNWPYLQADWVGYERALTEVLNLITIKEK